MLSSEEAHDSKEISRKFILPKNIENRSEMLKITQSEEELIANVEKRRKQEERYEYHFWIWNGPLHFMKHYFTLCSSLLRNFWFQIIGKKRNVTQKQHKPSLVPVETNLEALNEVRWKFTSNLCFGNGIDESEERLTANSIIFYLAAGVLYRLPAVFGKNLNSQYHGIVEKYYERQKEGRE